jgi:2-haloacid dehalogenase
VDMPVENVLSCDETGHAKPILDAYRPVLDKLSSSEGRSPPWFAAAHMWDVSAAKKVG